MAKIRYEIRTLIEKLSYSLLEHELRRRSIGDLIVVPNIGEATIIKLYNQGYKTLKDLDSIFFARSLMPKYVGAIRYELIKNWYFQEKKRRKREIITEVERSRYLNTKIGSKIEKLKRQKENMQKEMNKICKKISFFDIDLKRYKRVSFFNFLKNDMKISYKNIIDSEPIETKYSSKEVFGIPKISCIAKTDERAIEQFNKEFLLLKKKYPQSYRNMLFLDLSSRKIHPFIIHKGGISFSSEKRIVTIFFKEIKCCSKIGNTILLSIKNGTKIGFYLIEDSEVAYNYIKTFVTSVVKLQKND